MYAKMENKIEYLRNLSYLQLGICTVTLFVLITGWQLQYNSINGWLYKLTYELELKINSQFLFTELKIQFQSIELKNSNTSAISVEAKEWDM